MGIPLLKMTYILLTNELGARVRTLLHQIYSPSSPKKRPSHHTPTHTEADNYSLEPGTPVWQLYKRCEIIEKIVDKLPHEIQQQSGLLNYHHWFLGSIERWMERLFARTKGVISKDVDKDNFETSSSGVSFSAVETKSNFKIIKSSWHKLSWPEELEVDKVVKSLMYNLCGLGSHFTRLVVAKIETKLEEHNSGDLSFISAPVCTGLNNIQYLKKEIEAIPEYFGVNFSDYSSMVSKTTSKMDEFVSQLMDNIITKIRPVLFRGVEASCNTGNQNHLRDELLDKELRVLRLRLDDTNFANLLLKIWNALILIFTCIVDKNSSKHGAEYFMGVSNVVESCWFYFTPTDNTGIEPQLASTSEYLSLQKTLSNLKLPTESLFAKYYRERHEELLRAQSCTAELVVRAYFIKSDKLVVEVIMASNIIRTTAKVPDVQVIVRLVPTEWFQSSHNAKTKIQRKSETPVFEEKFEFCVDESDNGLKQGYLLFTLVKSQFLVKSQIIGEAVLPLEGVPVVDSPKAKEIKNSILNMNIPKDMDDYSAVKSLKFRTWDRRAQLFLQKMSVKN